MCVSSSNYTCPASQTTMMPGSTTTPFNVNNWCNYFIPVLMLAMPCANGATCQG